MNSAALTHIAQGDQEAAKDMLLALGIKYYSALTQSKVVDFKDLQYLHGE
jgi:hypothetical protein